MRLLELELFDLLRGLFIADVLLILLFEFRFHYGCVHVAHYHRNLLVLLLLATFLLLSLLEVAETNGIGRLGFTRATIRINRRNFSCTSLDRSHNLPIEEFWNVTLNPNWFLRLHNHLLLLLLFNHCFLIRAKLDCSICRLERHHVRVIIDC